MILSTLSLKGNTIKIYQKTMHWFADCFSDLGTWWGEHSFFSPVNRFPSKENRKLLRLTLSSDSDLGNLSPSVLWFPSMCSLCLLFFLRFLHSLALLELNLEASEELSRSSPNPPIPLKSLDAAEAAATACWENRGQEMFAVKGWKQKRRQACCLMIINRKGEFCTSVYLATGFTF